jgi:hypothetical protein
LAKRSGALRQQALEQLHLALRGLEALCRVVAGTEQLFTCRVQALVQQHRQSSTGMALQLATAAEAQAGTPQEWRPLAPPGQPACFSDAPTAPQQTAPCEVWPLSGSRLPRSSLRLPRSSLQSRPPKRPDTQAADAGPYMKFLWGMLLRSANSAHTERLQQSSPVKKKYRLLYDILDRHTMLDRPAGSGLTRPGPVAASSQLYTSIAQSITHSQHPLQAAPLVAE